MLYLPYVYLPIAVPTLRALGPGATQRDDNATPQPAKVIRDELQCQQVLRMDWPAPSPDLAPIEHFCDIIGRRVRDNHPTPLFHLWQQEWMAFPQPVLQNHVIPCERELENDAFLIGEVTSDIELR